MAFRRILFFFLILFLSQSSIFAKTISNASQQVSSDSILSYIILKKDQIIDNRFRKISMEFQEIQRCKNGGCLSNGQLMILEDYWCSLIDELYSFDSFSDALILTIESNEGRRSHVTGIELQQKMIAFKFLKLKYCQK